jgi:hypothetical protein
MARRRTAPNFTRRSSIARSSAAGTLRYALRMRETRYRDCEAPQRCDEAVHRSVRYLMDCLPDATLIPILTLSNPWLPSRGVRWT